MRRPAKPPLHRRRQNGIMLIVVMLLLLVTTLISLSAFRGATLEERMAANQRDRQTAFQAAEASLRDAEAMLRTNVLGPFTPLRANAFVATCVGGLCRSSEGLPLWSGFSEADWTGAKTWAYGAATGAPALQGVATQPRYAVEYQGTVQPIEPGKPCVAMFLITTRATGLNTHSNVVLQSVYRHRAGECYAGV